MVTPKSSNHLLIMKLQYTDLSHFENSSEFLCGFTDINLHLEHTNLLFQKQFGLENIEWKGKHLKEVIQHFQIEKFLDANQECINNPEKNISIEIETTITNKSNWFKWEICAITDEMNNVKGVRFLGTDITRQKKAEQTLLQQAILLDNISDVVISMDNNFNIKSWNVAAEKMFNLKFLEDGISVSHEIQKANILHDTITGFKRKLQTARWWSGNVYVEKNDGRFFFMQTRINTIKDTNDKSSGFVAVSRDITEDQEITKQLAAEQKKSKLDLLKEQQALKRSNELFEYASKATRDVIWDWNVKENTIRRTSGYKNLFGYKSSKSYEPNTFEKIHPGDRNNVEKIINKAINSNSSRWQIEYKYLCANGNYKIVIDQAYIIRDANGKAERIIGSMQDVTAERNLQNNILLTEIQKKKDVVNAVINAQEKERNELSSELHDNVNQLLAAAILYLKTAKKKNIAEERLLNLSLDHVEKAVNELRNISHNLTPGELKMNGLPAALKTLAGKLHIPRTFEIKLITNLEEGVIIDKSIQLAVYRIVQEMMNNILRHANASMVKIKLDETKNFLQLRVKDNGIGFNPSSIKPGLGIMNIFTRTENLGGTAEINSSPGKGCTWEINIPLNN